MNRLEILKSKVLLDILQVEELKSLIKEQTKSVEQLTERVDELINKLKNNDGI